MGVMGGGQRQAQDAFAASMGWRASRRKAPKNLDPFESDQHVDHMRVWLTDTEEIITTEPYTFPNEATAWLSAWASANGWTLDTSMLDRSPWNPPSTKLFVLRRPRRETRGR